MIFMMNVSSDSHMDMVL